VPDQPMINFASHQVRAGQVGASEDFEQMLGLLVRATSGEAGLVFANPGDWGIDVLVGDLHGRVTVWQAKYFVRGVGRSQRAQITASFNSAQRAAAEHGYTLQRWVLCIPSSMDGPTTQWWQGWKAEREREAGLTIELWDETRLRELLLRPGTADVRRHYYNPYRHDGQAAGPDAVLSPYRGLSAFEERDANLFFGRDAAAGRLLELMSASLDGPGLVVVSGVSGAGKSSLVRAGVLARLRESGLAAAPEAASWPSVVFAPGRDPLEELAVRVAPLARADAAEVRERLAADPAGFALTVRQATLADPAAKASAGAGQRRVLLVIDQCEQLFTLCQSTDERQAFITALHSAASGDAPAALVVLVVRADFEARLADYTQLNEAVQGRYLLTAMTERQLRLAITQPAAIAGSHVDGELVQVLLDETGAHAAGSSSPGSSGARAGVLPLLSHALDETWRTHQGLTLTLADYERTGGIEGAVAASAQRAYGRLTPARQEVAQQVFTRLTATSDDGTDTAVPTAVADLAVAADEDRTQDVVAVLETFAAERLLVIDADTVQISHEALLTAWPQLHEWLTVTHSDRAVRTTLHSTARDWERAARDPAYLYSGSRLEAARDAAARIGADARHTPLGPAENEFLRVSVAASRRRAQLRRSLTSVLLALVTALAVVAGIALHASQDARSASQASARERDAAISGQLATSSLALGTSSITASALESIAAWGLDPSSAQARYAVLNSAASPEVATFPVGDGSVNSVAFGPGGKTLATGGADGTARVWDLATGRQTGPSLRSSVPDANFVAFGPGGKTLVTSGGSGADCSLATGSLVTQVWDLATGRPIRPAIRDTPTSCPASNASQWIAASANGSTLALIAGPGDPVDLRDVATGRQLRQGFGSRRASMQSVALSPNGRMLATNDFYSGLYLWNVATGRRIAIARAGRFYDSLTFSPDGKILIDTSRGFISLWDVMTGKQIGRDFGGSADSSVALSPDGKTFAAAVGNDLQLWNVATGHKIGSLNIGPGAVMSTAFSPDGRTLAVGDSDGEVRLWNVAAIEHAPRTVSGGDASIAVAVSPNGKTVATDDGSGSAWLWSAATGRFIGPIRLTPKISPLPGVSAPGGVNVPASVAFSPDGKIMAAGDNYGGGLVREWDVADGHQIGSGINVAGNSVSSVTFSPNGRELATAVDSEGPVQLWDTATGREIGKSFPGTQSAVFSPDGKLLATMDKDGIVRLWNTSSGRQVGTPLEAGDGFIGNAYELTTLAFSPTGTTLASVNQDGSVALWDVATGQEIGIPLTPGTPGDDIQSLAFSPDGRTLATSDSGGYARLWDVATGQQIGAPVNAAQPDSRIAQLAFTPDGRTLVVGSGDGPARSWDVSYLVNPLAQLCSRPADSLTAAQWARYVPHGPAYRKVCP